MNAPPNYHVADFSDIEPVRCPCGWAKRAFADIPEAPASVHIVQIEEDARTHSGVMLVVRSTRMMNGLIEVTAAPCRRRGAFSGPPTRQ